MIKFRSIHFLFAVNSMLTKVNFLNFFLTFLKKIQITILEKFKFFSFQPE